MEDKEVKELEKALEQIWEIATKFGLDPFPTKFEIVPATVMYEVGSYALPGRYSHWTFGKAYHRMKTMYDFGLSKIYEVVINTNPAYGFLLETNSLLQNKLVIAHVMGHVDFFKNNAWFSKTNRRMLETVSAHTERMNQYEFKYGRKTVEKFLDAVLSIEEHIDPDFFIKRESANEKKEPAEKKEGKFDDLFALEKKEEKEEEEEPTQQQKKDVPEKDLVYYIIHHSPALEPWQRDVMSMIHEEMEYFVPQMQTKTSNEGWACATGDSLLITEKGFIRFDELYSTYQKIKVASGGKNELNWITDFHKEENVPTIHIRTRRGFTIEGAYKHRILLADGSWAYLKDIKIGDKVSLAINANVWSEDEQKFHYSPTLSSTSIETVAALSGVSTWTVLRHLKGKRTLRGELISNVLTETDYQRGMNGKVLSTRRRHLNLPETLNEELAWLLGYFIGDGNMTKSGIGFTTGDDELVRKLVDVIETHLGLIPNVKLDTSEGHRRWRVIIYSREIWKWLEWVGVNLQDRARTKKIPSLILRSPKNIVTSFLRGYFDADAYAGRGGVILSSSSKELIQTVQILLLNYGILSRQRKQPFDIRHLEINGASVVPFFREIGFSLKRKQDALHEFIEGHLWFKKEELDDEIVSIEYGCADVYDITVDEKHSYVANGFINHNSFWHSRIMRELDLSDAEHVEFADLHSSVVSPHKGQLNPYYVGYKIWEDIEKRFGREKLFEVREVDNDISFLRNYLTEELCEELDLFVFELIDEEEWTITEKRWEKVRDQLVSNMTNFGFPYIVVEDGDYDDNRELYLKHRYEGAELDENYARKTLEHIYTLWGRPVHLETVVEDETRVFHYDGEDHYED
jgi:stage V sporulation protein R